MKKILSILCAICLCLGLSGVMQKSRVAQAEATGTDWETLVDFVVEVEEGRDIRVLQLSDPQIISGDDSRTPSRGSTMWTKKEIERHEKFVEQIILNYKPDFMFIAGDIVYGEYDDNGDNLLRYIEFMDSFQIPWSPFFGNHDPENYMGIDWICEQFTKAKYCLFKQGNLTGNSNYSVGLVQGGKLKRTFFMLDSNGSHSASAASIANGQTKTTAGFGDDQIEWYTNAINAIKEVSPQTKFSFGFHIQISAFVDAFAKYGFNNTKSCLPIDIDTHPDREEGDFGYLGAVFPTLWDTNNKVWNGIKALGVDSLFVGHEHSNSGSVMYEGVRFQYGQKSSTYDSANYRKSDGTVIASYDNKAGTPIIGGTAIPVSEEDGSIVNPHIVYYEEGLAIEREFDFNGKDFNPEVKTAGINGSKNAVTKATENIPSGYDGEVYTAENSDYVSVGFEFFKNLRINKISSFKVKTFVTDYEKGTPTLKLYDSKTNTEIAQMKYPESAYGKWVEIDISSMLKSATALIKNQALESFSLVYDCDYVGGEIPKVYFDSVTINYTETLYDLERRIEIDPLSVYEESAYGQYRSHNYYRYTLSDFGETETWNINEKAKKVYKVGKKGYSVSFNLTPTDMKDISLTFLADENGNNGYSFSFVPNGISLDRPNGHPLEIYDYEFKYNKTVTMEVGCVRYDYNEKTGAGNGNVAYVFVKINGETVCWRLLDILDYKDREYFVISTYFDDNDLTLKSFNSVEYRTAGGKLLMKELSNGKITVTQEKINLYTAGLDYTDVMVDGEAFENGQSLEKGIHTVIITVTEEPEDDLYEGSLVYDIKDAEISINGGGEYDGTAKTIDITVKYGNQLKEDVNYSVEYFRGQEKTDDFISAGEIKVVIKGKGIYVGQIEKTCVITKKQISAETLSQTGETLSQDQTMIKVNGLALGDSVSSFTLEKEGCQIKFASLQIKNDSGKDVTDNYSISYVYGENHVYGEWVVVKEPAQTEKGERERVCQCGEKQTEEIDQLPSTSEPSTSEPTSEPNVESQESLESSSTPSTPSSEIENNKKGCKGSIGGLPLAILGIVACRMITRKREN